MKNSKRIIAREIVILFSTLVFIGLCFLFYKAQNLYVNHRIGMLNRQIDSVHEIIGKDPVIGIYNRIADSLEWQYKSNPSGIKVIYYDAASLDELFLPNIQKTKQKIDSFLILTGVNLTRFRELLRSKEYSNIVHHRFYKSWSSEKFDEMLRECAIYQQKYGLVLQKYKDKSRLAKSQIIHLKEYLLDKPTQTTYLKTLSIILLILLYPIRIAVIALIWAINTLKTTENKT